jgi:nucleoside-diphosphate-sugar epimerase
VVYAAAGCAGAEATREDAPVSLFHDTPYAFSKLVGEMYGNFYLSRYGLPFVKARFQNVHGPGEMLGAGRWRGTPETVWRNVTPTFIWKAFHGKPRPVENGGVASRDSVFVEDIMTGLVASALKGEPGEVYNLGSGKETTIPPVRRTSECTDRQHSANLSPTRPHMGSIQPAVRRDRPGTR